MTFEAGLRTYDTKNVLISINGVPILGGFAPDSKISVSTDNDMYTHVADIDGLVSVRSRNNDRVVTVVLKFMQTAQANALLNGYAQADKLGNAGVFIFNMSEVGGQNVVSSSTAYIIKDPDFSYDKEVGVIEWSIRCVLPTVNIGAGSGSAKLFPPSP
jgi:hypothetical protein